MPAPPPPARPLRPLAALIAEAGVAGDLAPFPQGALVPGAEVGAVADDSRRVRPGDLFVAVPGATTDGRRFLEAALRAGAAAAVVGLLPGERPDELPGVAAWRAEGRALLVTESPRRVVGRLAFAAEGHPDRKLTLVGVTGTNGKSTVTTLIRQIVQGAGRRAAELGTLGWRLGGGELVDLGNTTPGPVTLARVFREALDAGADTLCMEVSSHAIDQQRVDGLAFDVCVFTNLTRDHLDYHATMEAYAATKRGWITACRAAAPGTHVVTNADDEQGRAVAAEHAAAGERLWTFGVDRARRPRLLAERIEAIPSGTRALFRLGAIPRALETPLRGRFNVHNALAAMGAALAAGVPEGVVCRELAFLRPPSGRFEPIDLGQPFTVLVDYAHTPDALERLLESALELRGALGRRAAGGGADAAAAASGRIVVVFGCGGDRDRGKRPRMGQIAASMADRVVLTSDNPRSEDPAVILDEIRAGITSANETDVLVVEDRRQAIGASIADARAGDIILVAGKGHEAYQEVRGVRTPFRDQEVAAEAVREWLARQLDGPEP